MDSEYDDRERRAAGLPFRGMPKNSYNAVLYYEGDAFQARLAYNWRGKVMTNPEDWGGPAGIRTTASSTLAPTTTGRTASM